MRVRRYKTEKCRGKWITHDVSTSSFNNHFNYVVWQKCRRCLNTVTTIKFDSYAEYSAYLKEQNKIEKDKNKI